MSDAEFSTLAGRAIAKALPCSVRKTAGGGLAAVTDGTGRLVTHVFGHALERTPTDARTVFRIASMSKSFLAAAALSLRDEGLLDLRASIREYLPYAKLLWQGEPVDVTCAQLLSNRSGLPEDNAWGDRQLGISREAFRALTADGLRLALPPGLDYQYSNTGMALVGAVVEAVTGKPIRQVVGERLLEPLELEDTAYDTGDLPEGATIADGLRTFDEGRSFAVEPQVGDGALGCIGGLFSTAEDIGRWMSFLSSAFSNRPEHPEVLLPASRLEMQSAYTPAPVRAERVDLESAGYGYGLVVEQDRRFGRIVQHAGGLPGWSSHMRWHAASGIGVVVFGNSDTFGAGKHAIAILRDILESTNPPSSFVNMTATDSTDETAAGISVWPETLEAVGRIDELLRSGESLNRLGDFASPNLLLDTPGDVRDQRLAELTAQFGPVAREQALLDARITAAPNAAELCWTVACEYGELECTARLVGLAEPQLQSLTIAPAGRA